MELAIVTIMAGLLEACSALADSSATARRIMERTAPLRGILGVGLMAFGAYFLMAYAWPARSAFGYAPLLFVACSVGLLLDIVIGARFAAPWIARMVRPAPESGVGMSPHARNAQALRESIIGYAAVACGVLAIVAS